MNTTDRYPDPERSGRIHEFSPQLLPDHKYPIFVRFVMAACFYDDYLADRLSDYGVDTSELDDGVAQNHSLTLLRMFEDVSPELAPTHTAILNFALSRMRRIYLQLERRHSHDLNEQLQLGNQIMSMRESEEAALTILQRQLREFARHYGNQSVGVLGFVPSILVALGLEDLTSTTAPVIPAHDYTSATEQLTGQYEQIELTMLPFPEYGELVRIALAGCLYFDNDQSPFDDYGIDSRRLSTDDYWRNDASLELLSQLGFERPDVARIHAPIYNYIRARTHRVNCQLLSSSGRDWESREYFRAHVPQAQEYEFSTLFALRKEVRSFAERFGPHRLETIGLTAPVLKSLGLADACQASASVLSDLVLLPQAPERSREFRTIVDNILTIALEYIPLNKRPPQRSYTKLDMLPIIAGERIVDRFDQEFTDGSPALQSFYDALAGFTRARLKLFGYKDDLFLSEVDSSHRSYFQSDVSLDDLRIEEREMRTWLQVVLSHLARQYGSPFVHGLGITPEHFHMLGLPDLAPG